LIRKDERSGRKDPKFEAEEFKKKSKNIPKTKHTSRKKNKKQGSVGIWAEGS